MAKTQAVHDQYPIEVGLNILSGKWKLWHLSKGTIRFNELQRLLGGITTKTLTGQLRELEEQGIVVRKVFPEVPPKVENSLSEIGTTLNPILSQLCDWGKTYHTYMETKKTRKERALETKNKIFDTAVTLIKNKGYDNVTISEICQTAGLAKGSFYVHYKSKEDIVRESYYADLGKYIQKHYTNFVTKNPDKPIIERIIYFLNLELKFAEYAGYELTCLAYSLNLAACIPGPSEHFSKRHFSKLLYEEISQSLIYISSPFSCKDIFEYLESIVRGIMATWCFSNNSFNIVERGEKYIKQSVYSILSNQNHESNSYTCEHSRNCTRDM